MKMMLRWYGDHNPIPISFVRQIPCVRGIVSEVEARVGSVWPVDKINRIKETAENAGLEFTVVESVKVHEDIKLGLPSRDFYIDNFIQNIRNLGAAGIRVICYDFMPVFDWMRTETHRTLLDGSTTMAYETKDIENANPLSNPFALEDWEGSFTKEDLEKLYGEYSNRKEEDLWDSLAYFLKAVIPEAERSDVRLGIHPDDPPWPIFGLPRIITNETNIDRMLQIVNSPYNSLTLCSGSLGADPDNDVPALIRKYVKQDRVCFGHVRNIRFTGDDGSFEETSHYDGSGSLDIVEIMHAYWETGFTGPIRPDHGRAIFGEKGMAGYCLNDRALGAMYLSGIWDSFRKELKGAK